MPLLTVSMDGDTHSTTGGGRIAVRCTLAIEPDRARVQSRTLVIDGKPTLTVSVDPQEPIFISTMTSAELLSIEGWLGVNYSSPKELAVPIKCIGTGTDWFRIGIPIDDDTLFAIEEGRSGDFSASLCLRGLVQLTAPPVSIERQRLVQTRLLSVSTGPDIGSARDRLQIPREYWLGLLQHLGRKRYLLEIPVPPDLDKQNEWGGVASLLQLAQGFLDAGQHREAVAKCREVVEATRLLLSEQWQVSADGPFGAWAKQIAGRLSHRLPEDEKYRADVLAAQLQTAWDWTSGYHHLGTGVPSKDDASLCLHFTADLVWLASFMVKSWPSPLISQASTGSTGTPTG